MSTANPWTRSKMARLTDGLQHGDGLNGPHHVLFSRSKPCHCLS